MTDTDHRAAMPAAVGNGVDGIDGTQTGEAFPSQNTWLRPAAAGLTMLVVLLGGAIAWMMMNDGPDGPQVVGVVNDDDGEANDNDNDIDNVLGEPAEPGSKIVAEVDAKGDSAQEPREVRGEVTAPTSPEKATTDTRPRKAKRTTRKSKRAPPAKTNAKTSQKTKLSAKRPTLKRHAVKSAKSAKSAKKVLKKKADTPAKKPKKAKAGFVRVRTQND